MTLSHQQRQIEFPAPQTLGMDERKGAKSAGPLPHLFVSITNRRTAGVGQDPEKAAWFNPPFFLSRKVAA